ncbi:exodeoxyribonuclease VII small subunit [Haliangium ochraceum]|uniref:Exodeoxyribonuclease 7 small subunit n=1 Tax=Haliangium ochraceum (strain DSM 14365 / JCM 11303 / SMP-2) TaxID=502025 RepID=D0LIM8_HALO1|nr:exodeoxyribonuclease VII small subunit [Haliangium ochraceum]ACY18384.1 exodeoxyribonuclease VII, small subunit [Haliangium ochraceum DSM 14365]
MSDSNPSLTTEDIDALGFDHVLRRLRGVVNQLETGQLSLEESLRVYEEGVALARRGHQVLDGAESRVELLIQDGAREGDAATVPFDEPVEQSERDDDDEGR